MRVYITPVLSNKFNENIPDTCPKCNVCKGTYFHCIWECEEISKFWKEVHNMIGKILNVSLPLDQGFFYCICILSLSQRNVSLFLCVSYKLNASLHYNGRI